MTRGSLPAHNPGRETVAGVVQALRVLGCRGPAVAADVLEAANIRLDEQQRALVFEQIADPTEARARDVGLYESGWADAMAEVMTVVQSARVNGDDLDRLQRRVATLTPRTGNTDADGETVRGRRL